MHIARTSITNYSWFFHWFLKLLMLFSTHFRGAKSLNIKIFLFLFWARLCNFRQCILFVFWWFLSLSWEFEVFSYKPVEGFTFRSKVGKILLQNLMLVIGEYCWSFATSLYSSCSANTYFRGNSLSNVWR